ncbi:MAG: glycosyltransferase family 39 protein [Saprospiraceae bacterium]|nr:glycosyltransferase family 39 protein [Saprospiraceae bacterium]
MAAKKKPTTNSVNKTVTAQAKSGAAQAPKQVLGMFREAFWKNHWAPAVLLVALSFVLYGASIGYGYMLDDEMVITKNVYVQKGTAGLRDIFAYDSFMGYFQKKQSLYLLPGGRYRPLSLATFALEVSWFGKDKPNVSHFINILLYALTALLLYRILLSLFPIREGGKWYFSVAFIAALVFVAHPLHTECVANIKGRDEILALLCSLAALYASLRFVDAGQTRWLLGSGIFMFLGMFAKENALTFLAVIPLTLWFFTKAPKQRITTAILPLAGFFLVFLMVRYQALGFMLDHGKAPETDLMNNPFMGMNPGEKLATIFLTLGWYLKLLFVPNPLTHDYYPYHVPKVNWSDWRALLSLALYAGMAVWAVFNVQKRKLPAYAILFYLITLSIVSNLLVSVGTFMNERFVYMPSVAFCLLAGWFFARQLPQWLKEQDDKPYLLGLGLTLVLLVGYGLRTYTRVPDWKDAISLNSAAVRVSEGSARSHCFYVTAIYQNIYLTSKDQNEKNRWLDTMEYHINRSLEINPNYTAALIMKAPIVTGRFEQKNRSQLDKLFHEFEIIIEKIPYNPNYRDYLDSYIKYLRGAANNDKSAAFFHRVGYEFFFQKKKDYENALHFLQFGVDLQTEDIRILTDMSEVYEAMGNQAKAQEFRERAEQSRNM